MNKEIMKKAGEIVEKNTRGDTYCSLGLIDVDGYPTVSTITASKADGIRVITFGTGLHSTKTERINKCNRASVCFNAPDYNITLVGRIEVVTDPEIKKETWYQGLEMHYKGYEDPEFCVLKFVTERYNLLVDWQEIKGDIGEIDSME